MNERHCAYLADASVCDDSQEINTRQDKRANKKMVHIYVCMNVRLVHRRKMDKKKDTMYNKRCVYDIS